MTVILRKLENKRHWDEASWLDSNDTQADVLKNFSTSNNELSIFVLEEPDAQIERVVAALAARRDFLSHLDLAVVPCEVLEECDIDSSDVQGETPDQEVNGWHQNLIQLTVSKISLLISFVKSEGDFKRYQGKDVEQAIKNSLDANAFDVASIASPKLIASLKKRQII